MTNGRIPFFGRSGPRKGCPRRHGALFWRLTGPPDDPLDGRLDAFSAKKRKACLAVFGRVFRDQKPSVLAVKHTLRSAFARLRRDKPAFAKKRNLLLASISFD